jgi:hypothetical protein
MKRLPKIILARARLFFNNYICPLNLIVNC